ncbi:PAS domain-containing protein [Streptomyces sp. NPDC046985]|uniref:PAS domain-containing protein n=1 Tax=Streptomyces sp. NPDC046985 TaxID=3155377 RepID=UPI0033C81C7C
MSSRPSRGAARLAAILDALPDALLLVNANGTVVNANTIALEAFETPGTALVGRGLLDLLPQFDSQLIPGSMRRPGHIDPPGRTKPTRMVARRTDGAEFPVEVTSANLEDGQQAYDGHGYTGDELLMLVVRDLSGTVDTEAELARSQRQTEMILRAASEGVVGTDTDGRVVLVNPAAAQILGYRAGELGGRELHTLVLHSRGDGAPFPYDESPLADTLRSGRKHRVRGQVLWSKAGDKVPVDLTTAPVRDGDQLVGAVMTFADRRPYDALTDERDAAEQRHAQELEQLAEEHASDLTALRQRQVAAVEELTEGHTEELAAHEDRYAALGEREKDRYEALAARHEQLLTLLGGSLRGPLDQLRRELAALAADDAGQLWPEANQVLHHLSAGYSRITTLIDNVLGYQRLDTGGEQITRTKAMLDAVVAAGIDGAVELVGPGRVQFAVHAPPIEAEVDPQRLATALAHLVADVAGVDSTGNAPVSTGGYMDSTVVVAAAQRGEAVRIEVRGPYAGGDPVHQPIVRGIVRAHGGVLQTHEVPGMSGTAYVLDVPIGAGAGTVGAAGYGHAPLAVEGPGAGSGAGAGAAPGVGAELAVVGDLGAGAGAAPGAGVSAEVALPAQASGGGRRRARRGSTDAFLDGEGDAPGADASAADSQATPTGRRRRRAAEEAAQAAAPDAAVEDAEGSGGTGRRRGRPAEDASVTEGVAEGAVVTAAEHAAGAAASGSGLGGTVPPQGVPAGGTVPPQGVPALSGRRARRDTGEAPALPAALPAAPESADSGDGFAPVPGQQPTGRRRRALAAATERAAAQEAAPRTVFALPPADADRSTGAHASTSPPAPSSMGESGADAVIQPQPQLQPRPQSRPRSQSQPQSASAPQGEVQPGARVPSASEVQAAAPSARQAAGVPRQAPGPGAEAAGGAAAGRHEAVPHSQDDDHTPPQPHPVSAPTGRRRRAVAQEGGVPAPAQGGPLGPVPPPGAQGPAAAARPLPQGGAPAPAGPVAPGAAAPQPWSGDASAAPGPGAPVPPHGPAASPAPATPPASATPGAPAAAPAAAVPPATAPPSGVPAPPSGGLGAPVPPGGPSAPQPPDASAPRAPGAPVPPPRGSAPQPPAPGQALAAGPASATAPGAAPQGVPATGAPLPPEQGAVPALGQPPAAPKPAPGSPAAPRGARPGPAARPAQVPAPRAAQPLPAEASASADTESTQGGRAFSVRTLGQGVPFSRQAAHVQQPTATPPHGTNGSGRRRKLGTPPDPAAVRPGQAAAQAPASSTPAGAARPAAPAASPAQPTPPAGQPRRAQANHTSQANQVNDGPGRSYAIGAPDENAAEGPEPLDGPGGAVEVADMPRPQPLDDELPPEPLDNPRRLLVWPAPDATTQQALSDRGYRPVIVHSREEVAAQIAAFPAALFVDPLTGPITRTALQALRQAAVAAEVPVLVTAGLGQASREAAYGADPAVLLKALAPRDSEQHPPRVLLIEEHAEIALALTATLERRGMQVARAASDNDAVALAGQFRPNLVVMDLMQVHRRRAGILDWLRANGQLNRTPLVVYTAAVDQADLPRLASGETVLFLAERSTSGEVQTRIVDLLARIGTN